MLQVNTLISVVLRARMVKKSVLFVGMLIGFILPGFIVFSQKTKPFLPVEIEKGGIVYNADTVTGDRVPDYSYCGYRASEEPIPMVPVKVVVPLLKGDASALIQAAIDRVASLPVDKNGFRGAVLLSKGIYEVSEPLRITVSGIVLRGFGAQGQTILLGKGVDRNGLIVVSGKNDQKIGTPKRITQRYVPVGASSFTVDHPAGLQTGDPVFITRPSTKKWIDVLGTESFGGGISALGWKPGDIDLVFDRRIVAIDGNRITVDLPLTTSLDSNYGGGTISAYNWVGRISQIGIENLTLQSDYNRTNPKDEEHRWIAINLAQAEDAWVRQVSFAYFAGSAVFINEAVRRVTVEDCISTHPVSEIGGQRRMTFFTRGQQTLFQRCFSEGGNHDYSVGHGATGPNAFVQCVSERPFNFNGTVGMWASGVLFDLMQVDGNAIRVGNRAQDGRGAGWSGANCFFWNCSAALIECDQPPTAQNWSYGSWSQFAGKGFWAESNNNLSPRSFFYAQLAQRLGKDFSKTAAILETPGEASSSPSVAVAQALTKEAEKPKMKMDEWIRMAAKRNPIATTYENAIILKPVIEKIQPSAGKTGLVIKNGWLVQNGGLLFGKQQEVPWWTGGVEAKDLQQAKQKMALTRFVPGRAGAGLTDNLEEVADSMKANNIVALNQHYALWYERRRDDHERIRRMDGEVWPPFYELPFARSGKDTAWDGLSKYDLTKYNTWYWKRLQDFAAIAAANNLVLFHQNYFQHNIIEAGAHYADFPWRTANNINNTGFVEPVNYAGDKRIFYASQFYDLSHPGRKKLHQLYIEQCLNNFKDKGPVVQFTSEEYTGPLHFVEFWLQTIANWQQKNKTCQKQVIGLSATKDVQDAILKNPKYAPVVDLIEIKYWHYQADGTLYAPEGGKNLAPRQWARLLKPKTTSFDQVYRAVKEYRDQYPGKAVVYSGDAYDKYGWAVLMAGGSLPVLPKETAPALLSAATDMKPLVSGSNYMLSSNGGAIIYCNGLQRVSLGLPSLQGSYRVQFFSTETGRMASEIDTLRLEGKIDLTIPAGSGLVWLQKL